MTKGKTSGWEKAVDCGAASIFALCAGWSLLAVGVVPMGVAGGAAVAWVVVLVIMDRIGGARTTPFAPVEAQFDEPVDDTLLLEDRLAEPAEDSRVVRLFASGHARPAMVPGELASQIDNFLGSGRAMPRTAPVQPDAAQELYEALAEIRRTLR